MLCCSIGGYAVPAGCKPGRDGEPARAASGRGERVTRRGHLPVGTQPDAIVDEARYRKAAAGGKSPVAGGAYAAQRETARRHRRRTDKKGVVALTSEPPSTGHHPRFLLI
ncbi:hypothetical protein Axi01nite_95020 [Actinoplanes xinjiangensis]|nr:hypothetical protein Axi01nite_95020 [Actinoplanes xinjiangensis]